MNTFTSPNTSSSTIVVGRAARQPLRRAAAWLRARWHDAWLDERTRYLSQATDHVDLERRQRALAHCDCRPPC